MKKRKYINVINNINSIIWKPNIINEKILKTFECNRSNIKNIISSNNIIVFKYNNKNIYFKECRKHLEKHQYIDMIIDDYFNNIYKDSGSDEIKKIIKKDLRIRKNLKLFSILGEYCRINHNVVKEYNDWNTALIGLPTLFNLSHEINKYNYSKKNKICYEFMNNNFTSFISYMKNEINAYNIHKGMKKGNYQIFRSLLGKATYKLSELLNVDYMFENPQYAFLKIDNEKIKFGSYLKEIDGICPLELDIEEKKNISPEFQRQLCNLSIFDTLCFQRDHKQENYFIEQENKKVVKLCAFDNDSPMTFFPFPFINYEMCVKCVSIIKKGVINRPYIDKEFANTIINIKNKNIKEELKNYLSIIQIWGLMLRLMQLKKAILKTMKLFPERFIGINDWNQKTIDEELNGNFGKTYLKHYIECDENKIVEEIMNNQK